MSQKNPPALAAWMLEHLTPGRGNQALAGDLLEEFRSGRSAAWYWRQVLGAIVLGCAKELRTHWPALSFAVLWTVPLPAFWLYVVGRLAKTTFVTQEWRLKWPYSTICDLAFHNACGLFYIWSGLALYFLFSSLAMSSLSLRRLARAFWISLCVYLAAVVGLGVLAAALPVRALLEVRPVVDGRVVVIIVTAYHFLALLAFFLALVISIWTARPRVENKTASAAQ